MEFEQDKQNIMFHVAPFISSINAGKIKLWWKGQDRVGEGTMTREGHKEALGVLPCLVS